MNKLAKAYAMKCFGRLVEDVECDPDPQARYKLMEEYNCKNCDSKEYCDELAKTLR